MAAFRRLLGEPVVSSSNLDGPIFHIFLEESMSQYELKFLSFEGDEVWISIDHILEKKKVPIKKLVDCLAKNANHMIMRISRHTLFALITLADTRDLSFDQVRASYRDHEQDDVAALTKKAAFNALSEFDFLPKPLNSHRIFSRIRPVGAV